MNDNDQKNSFEDLIPPDNYLVWAILTTIFCCQPIGIVAIIKAAKVNTLWESKQYDKARIASDEALKYVKYSVLAAVLFWIIYLFFALVLGIGANILN